MPISHRQPEPKGQSSEPVRLRIVRPLDLPEKRDESISPPFEIEEQFRFRVLDDEGGHLADGHAAKLVGRRLIARVSEYIAPDTCVRIDSNDAFVLGVALGCWREGPAILVALELHQVLSGLAELARAVERESEAVPLVRHA